MTTDFTSDNMCDCWEQDGFVVELYYDGFNKDGRQRLHYCLFDGNKMIFDGTDFYPPQVQETRDFEKVMALLGFLTLQPGDTDDEYFKDYTPEQLDWCTSSRAEELRYIVMDFEDPIEEEVA